MRYVIINNSFYEVIDSKRFLPLCLRIPVCGWRKYIVLYDIVNSVEAVDLYIPSREESSDTNNICLLVSLSLSIIVVITIITAVMCSHSLYCLSPADINLTRCFVCGARFVSTASRFHILCLKPTCVAFAIQRQLAERKAMGLKTNKS